MPDTRALVLAGGGVTGIAWELGLVVGLSRQDVDVTAADLILGTSAGSTVGAQIASGVPLTELQAAQLADETSEITVDLDVDEFRARLAELVADAPDPQAARARVGRMALEAKTVPEAVRRRAIEARLPVHEWPAQRLVVTAVDAATGELALLDRDAGVPLVDAVAASCAVPGVWPPVTIDGRRYVDGGARSLANADLAAGHDRVLVVVPMALEGPYREQLDAELAILAETGKTRVIAADDASLAAIGPNPLDPSRRAAAYRAGSAQGEAAAAGVAEFWR
ncbi:MAG TPA: patatin-like phospholipase family protein [Acidimicrobiales bacterium]|nr:patatin-like phospholipase family protein [Acidimicrobiales bacterium]